MLERYSRLARAAISQIKTLDKQYQAGGESALEAIQLFRDRWPHYTNAFEWLATNLWREISLQPMFVSMWTSGQFLFEEELPAKLRLHMVTLAVQCARACGDKEAERALEGNIGNAYYDLNRLHSAARKYRHALRSPNPLGKSRETVYLLANLGAVYTALEKNSEAYGVLVEAQELAVTLQDKLGEAVVLGNMGTLAHEIKEYEQSISMHKRSAQLHEETGDYFNAAIALQNLGVAFYDNEQSQAALPALFKALEYANLIDRQALRGEVLVDLGNVLRDIGEAEKGRSYIETSIELLTMSNSQNLLPKAYLRLGRSKEDESVEEAGQDYLTAFNKALAVNDAGVAFDAAYNIACLSHQTENIEHALIWVQQAEELIETDPYSQAFDAYMLHAKILISDGQLTNAHEMTQRALCWAQFNNDENYLEAVDKLFQTIKNN